MTQWTGVEQGIPSPSTFICSIFSSSSTMYERFTDKAKTIVTKAHAAKEKFGDHNITGYHILLAITTSQFPNMAQGTLKNLDVDLTELSKNIEDNLHCSPSDLPQTGSTPGVYNLAWTESQNLGHNYIGTEHLLLAVFEEKESGAAKLLQNAGVDKGIVLKEILDLLGGS